MERLLDYAARGGTLLVTGPVDRDEHWQPVNRTADLGVTATVVPLAVRGSDLTRPNGNSYSLGFPADVQQAATWTMRFADGKSVENRPSWQRSDSVGGRPGGVCRGIYSSRCALSLGAG